MTDGLNSQKALGQTHVPPSGQNKIDKKKQFYQSKKTLAMKLVQALNTNNNTKALALVAASTGKKRANTSVGMARKAINASSAHNFQSNGSKGRRQASRHN